MFPTIRLSTRGLSRNVILTRIANKSSMAASLDLDGIVESQKEPELQHYVSTTAVMVAHMRGLEALKGPNALFVDPIASKMYDPEVSFRRLIILVKLTRNCLVLDKSL